MPFVTHNLSNDDDLSKNISWQTFRPIRIDQRMINQDAVFTFHKDPTLDFAEELKENVSGVIVPAGRKKFILNQLSSIGIHEMFIYPGLDSLCKQIDSNYSEKYSPEENAEFFTEGAFPNDMDCSDKRVPYLKLENTPSGGGN